MWPYLGVSNTCYGFCPLFDTDPRGNSRPIEVRKVRLAKKVTTAPRNVSNILFKFYEDPSKTQMIEDLTDISSQGEFIIKF